ncbi:MAG: hypothetical protein ACREUR_04465 [Nitrosospira sp.]
MENDKQVAVLSGLKGVSVTGGSMLSTSIYFNIKGDMHYDPEIEGLGVLSIDFTLPVSKEFLVGKDISQLQELFSGWLIQAVREESLREWFEMQSAQAQIIP